MKAIEKINSEIKDAMLRKDAARLNVLRAIKASATNLAIEKKALSVESLCDSDVISIMRKAVKTRTESAEAFKRGNRPELAEKELEEIKILDSYLPKPLSENEIRNLAAECISETKATSRKDMGRVMKAAQEKSGGRADSRALSSVVSHLLDSLN